MKRLGPRMINKRLEASRPFRSMFMREKIGRGGEKGKGIWEDGGRRTGDRSRKDTDIRIFRHSDIQTGPCLPYRRLLRSFVSCLPTPSLPTFINFLFHLSKKLPNIVPIMKLVKDIVTTRLRDIDPTKA